MRKREEKKKEEKIKENENEKTTLGRVLESQVGRKQENIKTIQRGPVRKGSLEYQGSKAKGKEMDQSGPFGGSFDSRKGIWSPKRESGVVPLRDC